MVSSSVTRMPWMNSPCLPILFERLLDLRAAAVHDHRVHADQLQQHDVVARSPACSAASVMALPPYLMTIVLPWNLRM